MTDDIHRFLGTRLGGPDGTELGTIHRFYFDDRTARPEWAAITLDDGPDRLVPIATASTESGVLRVPYPRHRVATAPTHPASAHISPAQEATLRRHYGIGTILSTMTSGSTSPTGPPGPA
ncbi:hypothetical protein [Actinocorallia longicatena]|uniref:PRC-barrel domain-containing protein n=1 Tax=Actinocorallia longicatena TaxID=111803 RepID=A0ABP6QBH9_9ACTN